MRLNRYIARSGICSRRKAEKLIIEGRVYVNDKQTTNLSYKTLNNDVVKINNKIITLPKFVYYALNKPIGYTTTKSDRFAKKTIFELLPNDKGLFNVGRLDKNTTGLIIVTNDGEFGQNIIHPSKKIEKEYKVKTKNPINQTHAKELENGLELDDGFAKANKVKLISNKSMIITIEEGRNRIIRRMIKAINNDVAELERIRIGNFKLDTKPGEFRNLTKEEIDYYV